MTFKPERNAPCPCGSGRKYKKCCSHQPLQEGPPIFSWLGEEGFQVALPGLPPTPLEQAQMTASYQANIRNSELWPQLVAEFGVEKAAALLKECRVEFTRLP